MQEARQGPLRSRLFRRRAPHRDTLWSRTRSSSSPPAVNRTADRAGRCRPRARPTPSSWCSATTSRPAARRWADNHLGDRSSLDLVGQQHDLARAILALGKPTVVVLLNGRPLSVNYLAAQAPALVEGWYLGQETGHAVADVLFGKVNPGGKLPVSIPRAVGQLPVYLRPQADRRAAAICSIRPSRSSRSATGSATRSFDDLARRAC